MEGCIRFVNEEKGRVWRVMLGNMLEERESIVEKYRAARKPERRVALEAEIDAANKVIEAHKATKPAEYIDPKAVAHYLAICVKGEVSRVTFTENERRAKLNEMSLIDFVEKWVGDGSLENSAYLKLVNFLSEEARVLELEFDSEDEPTLERIELFLDARLENAKNDLMNHGSVFANRLIDAAVHIAREKALRRLINFLYRMIRDLEETERRSK